MIIATIYRNENKYNIIRSPRKSSRFHRGRLDQHRLQTATMMAFSRRDQPWSTHINKENAVGSKKLKYC